MHSNPPNYEAIVKDSPFKIPYKRPAEDSRLFTCRIVEQVIQKVQLHFMALNQPEIGMLFQNCFPNTLDTTVFSSLNDTFIITGDINAMWLRDSTNQVAPYLPLLKSSPKLTEMVHGLINRQVKCVLSDPWANAFKEHAKSPESQWAFSDDVFPPVSDLVFECKFELDSLAAFFKISNGYFEHTLDKSFITKDWISAIRKCLSIMKLQQQGSMDVLGKSPYMFKRSSDVPTDTLMLSGQGPPAKACGLVKCGFRPSDDACTFPFLIPANAMASVELKKLGNMIKDIDPDLSNDCLEFSRILSLAILKHGIVNDPEYGKVYAYEVDGFGNALLMDDANVPSILSLPYLGFVDAEDEVYLNSRKLVLGDRNPYYFTGIAGKGIGGPHVGLGYIWPMSIAIQALTTVDMQERDACISMLINTTAGTGFIHESFHKDDTNHYTRGWFAWANSLVGELLYKVAKETGCLLP